MLTDAYKLELLFDDACLEAKAKFITKFTENFANIGGEDAEVDEDNKGTTVIDVVDGLKERFYPAKGDFLAIVKEFLAATVKRLTEEGKADRVPIFKKGATAMIQTINKKFSDVQFFVGNGDSENCSLAFAFMKEDSDTEPVVWFFNDALKEEKQ
jgi:hypothetical protein